MNEVQTVDDLRINGEKPAYLAKKAKLSDQDMRINEVIEAHIKKEKEKAK